MKMKKVLVSIVVFVGACLVANVFASQTSSDDAAKVTAFYQQYAQAWCLTDVAEMDRKCDSLMAIYCTATLCNDTKSDRVTGVGYDYATDNNGMDMMSAQTLLVSNEEDYYKVAYRTNFMNDRRVNVVKQINLKVELENGKISKVSTMEQILSFLNVYCTPALCQEATNDPIGYDYATDDAGMDEMSLQTLQVSKDGTDYKVSYKTNFKNDRYEKTIVQVSLKVVLENGKISKVTKMQQPLVSSPLFYNP